MHMLLFNFDAQSNDEFVMSLCVQFSFDGREVKSARQGEACNGHKLYHCMTWHETKPKEYQ